MIKKLGEFLLAKELNAIIAAFISALLPMLYFPTGFIAVIIVGLVTLQKGTRAGLKVLAWVALPAIALLVLRKLGSFDVLLFRCIMIWILASLLHRYHAWGLLFEVVAVAGIVLVMALHLAIPDLQNWWVIHITRYINGVIPAADWKMKLSPAEFAHHIAPIATGVSGFFFSCSVIVELMIARYWQSVIVNPGGFGREFVQIRLGNFAIVVMSVLFLMCLFKLMPAIDALPFALLPFFFAGLSVLHFVVRQKKQLTFALILIYAGLFFLPALMVSILVVIALVDTGYDFRKKIFNVGVSS